MLGFLEEAEAESQQPACVCGKTARTKRRQPMLLPPKEQEQEAMVMVLSNQAEVRGRTSAPVSVWGSMVCRVVWRVIFVGLVIFISPNKNQFRIF